MGKSNNRKRERERRRQQDQRSSAEALAYSSVSSVEPAPTEKHSPRTPNSFFSSSYSVKMTTTKTTNHNSIMQQIVHRHVNGLCIVTIGNVVPKITSIEYMAKEAPAFSNAQHRKRQTKMLNGCVVDNTVTPSTILAHLRICHSLDKNGEEDDESTGTRQQQTTIVPIFACVFGTILELNHSITPKIISDDPLLDGYIAIILPTGNFPPFRGENSLQQTATGTATAGHQNDQDEKKKKKLEI